MFDINVLTVVHELDDHLITTRHFILFFNIMFGWSEKEKIEKG